MTKGKRNGRDSVIEQRRKLWDKNDRRALSGPSVGSAPASAESAAAGRWMLDRSALSLVDLVLGEVAFLGLLFQKVDLRLVLGSGLLAGEALLLGTA